MNWFKITDGVCTIHFQPKHKNMYACVPILKEKKSYKLKKGRTSKVQIFFTQEYGKKSSLICSNLI